ncbi:MAG: exodeoxyribonuclease III [Kiloniellales bacterium]
MVKIATWNVNSIKARLVNALAWVEAQKPDVLLLQEIKCIDDNFPRLEFEALGYKVESHGQKTYNGVAILSKSKIEAVRRGLPGGDDDQQARYIEATTFGLQVASIYLPNGNPVGTEKFSYKLKWLTRLRGHVAGLLRSELPSVLGGDYNVIPEPRDCHDPAAWMSDALFQPESRRALRSLIHLGLTDAFRGLHPQTVAYSFWDYQGNAFAADHGIRIDHLLLSPQAADRLSASGIDRDARAKEKASDHTPVWCELAAA